MSNWLHQVEFSVAPEPDIAFTAVRFDSIARDQGNDGAGITLPVQLLRASRKRQAEYIAGRYCALQSIRKLNRYANEISMNADRSPSWPDGLIGSISHCRQYAIAAVACRNLIQSVGIDVENLLDSTSAHAMADGFLRTEEIALCPFSDFGRYATLVFSAKESLFKALHPLTGRYFEPLDARVMDCDEQSLRLELLINLDLNWQSGRILHIRHGIHEQNVWTFIKTRWE